jgi:hypothetical protein
MSIILNKKQTEIIKALKFRDKITEAISEFIYLRNFN